MQKTKVVVAKALRQQTLPSSCESWLFLIWCFRQSASLALITERLFDLDKRHPASKGSSAPSLQPVGPSWWSWHPIITVLTLITHTTVYTMCCNVAICSRGVCTVSISLILMVSAETTRVPFDGVVETIKEEPSPSTKTLPLLSPGANGPWPLRWPPVPVAGPVPDSTTAPMSTTWSS